MKQEHATEPFREMITCVLVLADHIVQRPCITVFRPQRRAGPATLIAFLYLILYQVRDVGMKTQLVQNPNFTLGIASYDVVCLEALFNAVQPCFFVFLEEYAALLAPKKLPIESSTNSKWLAMETAAIFSVSVWLREQTGK